MKKLIFAAAPLAFLSACSGASDGIEPGEWTLTMEMTEIDAPDAPPAALNAMRQQQAQSQSQCITPAQAANPDGGLFAPQGNENCDDMSFTMSGGDILLEATCNVPGAGEMQMTIDGTYDRDSIDAEMEMVMAETPVGPMTMRGTMTGAHTGECDA